MFKIWFWKLFTISIWYVSNRIKLSGGKCWKPKKKTTKNNPIVNDLEDAIVYLVAKMSL